MSLYLIALEEFFFHELVQSFLNPCKFTASTTSCGKEFHGLIIHCIENHFPLFVLNPSPPCSIWCPLALVLEKTENNCSSFPFLFDFIDLCHLPLIHNLVLNEQSKAITLTLDCLKLFFPPNGNPHWAERSERVFRMRKNKMSGWICNISNHHHLQGAIFDLWVLGKFLSTIWGIMKEFPVLQVHCKSNQRITPHLNLLIKTTIRKRWQKYTICLPKDQFSLLTFGSNYIASRHLTCYLLEISAILYYNITESFID